MSADFFLLLLSFLCSADGALRPNIIFMMADQQRQDSIGAYPNSVGQTPNIDSIAKDGILFTNAWTSTPSCTPARAAILTGRDPWHHGMLGYGAIAQQYPYELIHPLNDAGYITASIGKNHFGYSSGAKFSPITHGYQYYALYDGIGTGLWSNATSTCANSEFDNYDAWFQSQLPGSDPLATGKSIGMNWNSWRGASYVYDADIHPTEWIAEKAMQWLETYAQNDTQTQQPFFLKISFHRPHSPYDAPDKYAQFVTDNYNLTKLTDIIHGYEWDDRYTDPRWCSESQDSAWCGWFEAQYTNVSRVYYHANVRFIDDMVGEIVDTLKRLELYDPTYILYSSDHGDQLGDHNLWRKTYAYNSNAKVPMIIKWPALSANTTFDVNSIAVSRGTVEKESIVELRDVLPTLHDVAGIELPSEWSNQWSGMNMNCLLNDCNEWREWLDLEHTTCYNVTNHWSALTDGVTYKYIFHAFFANESLFDLAHDPNEMYDLAPLTSSDSVINETLTLWRNRLVSMFEQQNRGSQWVQNGTLQQRTQSQVYSPNYPGDSPLCMEKSDETFVAFVK